MGRRLWPFRGARRPQAFDGGIDRPPDPPRCPEGWTTGPPHFIGVGVQRSGTTRWCNLISAHPEVVQGLAPKELHYFDRFYAGGFTGADAAAYHRYFPRPAERHTGEWTPLYMSAPWIPPLLARAAPQARLLALLRDPVERFVSGLALNGKVAARRGAPLSRYAPLEAFSRGFYHRQLAGLQREHLDVVAHLRAERVEGLLVLALGIAGAGATARRALATGGHR